MLTGKGPVPKGEAGNRVRVPVLALMANPSTVPFVREFKAYKNLPNESTHIPAGALLLVAKGDPEILVSAPLEPPMENAAMPPDNNSA